MSAARIEALIAAHVPRNQIKEASDVYAHKWWDYRRLSPGHSFLLFAHAYYRSFKIAARKMIQIRKRDARMTALIGAGEVQFTADQIWDRDQRHITGMWKAMLLCDSLGLPYDHFCRLSFTTAIDRAWHRLPRPMHMYAESLCPYTLEEWDKLTKDRLIVARHPVFLVANYQGTPLQDEYRGWLLDTLSSRKSVVPALAEHVFSRPQLTEADLAGRFPRAAINRARLLAS